MSLSEQVAKLEQENINLRSMWRRDLEVLVMIAERHNETEIVEATKECLKNLQ